MKTLKKIGIISAMDTETNLILNSLQINRSKKIGITSFYSGILFGTECVIATSGVGKVFSAACTQAMIMNFNPDLILNAGIAGSLCKTVKINDIVVASSVVQYDLDKTSLGQSLGLISGLNIINIPSSKSATEKILYACQNTDSCISHKGVIATGDTFIADQNKKDFIHKNFSALACDMESGSIGQVCYINNVDFAIIRKISDNADEKSLMSYDDFELKACEKIFDVISNFFKMI